MLVRHLTIRKQKMSASIQLPTSKLSSSTVVLLFLVRLLFVDASHRQVVVPGDILIGGLFPIHEGSRNASGSSLCGRIKADQGVQRMVSMLFALEQVNKSPRLLPGLHLGAQILDTCSVETHALEQSLQFIKSVCAEEEDHKKGETLSNIRLWPVGSSNQRDGAKKQKIAAVIGAASSQVSVMVASMLQLFRIPMLSYSSTGVELSEKPRFAYFSRVVPPDNLQAKAMAHLIAKLGWNYVHAIVDTGSYGERGMDSFRAAATELNICIDGDVHKISRRWTDDQFEELLHRMRAGKARGVVMFVDEDNLRRFVASDSWGMKSSVIKGFEHLVNGAITVAPKVRFLKGFTEYFASLGPSNTFLSEYWQSMNCSEHFHPNFGSCFNSQGYAFKQEAYVPFVYDAVQLVARALHTYIQEECGLDGQWSECVLADDGFDGKRLQQLYRNVSLIAGQPPLIDANGDGNGQYSIFQLDGKGMYRRVGGWMDRGLVELDVDDIRHGLRKSDGSVATIPLSVCSLPCPAAHYRAYQDQSCCWTCIPCDTSTSIIPNETRFLQSQSKTSHSSCIQCPLGEVPNMGLEVCEPIKPVHLEWDSPWALVPAFFSAFGLLATAAVTIVFFRFNYTPVVMASGRELCYCMLTGIALCYGITFVLVSPPSELICTLTRVLLGLSMAIVYAAILVKTNRLARVFKPNSALRPRWIGPSAQVFFCTILASVQLGVALVWIWLEPPGTAIQYPSRTEAVLTCKATLSHLLISLLYCGLLIIACTIYAFKTRKIPENFNETRLIGFTMYSTSILWLAFGPIYFATQNNFKIQLTSLCMTISLSGTVALACFFAPKVYICLFQPYKNVRTRSSAVGKLVNQQMRFISQITSPAGNNDKLSSSQHSRYKLPTASHCTVSTTGGNSEPASATSPYRVGTTNNPSALRRRSSVGTCFMAGHQQQQQSAERGLAERKYLRRMETIATGSTTIAHSEENSSAGRRQSKTNNGYQMSDGNFVPSATIGNNRRRQSLGRRRSSSSQRRRSTISNVSEDGHHKKQPNGAVLVDVYGNDNITEEKPNGRATQQPNNPVQLILREIDNESFATFL